MLKILNGEIFLLSANTERKSSVTQYTELYFVTMGVCRFGGDKVSAGEGFFAPVGGYVTISPVESQEQAKIVRFIIDGDDSERLLAPFDGECVFRLSNKAITNVILALCPNDHYESLGDSADQAVAKLLLSLPVITEASLCAPRSGKGHVDAAVKYIKENYASELKVEHIAEKLCVDRKYLRNLFTEHMGMSTMDFLMQTRMTRAEELLADESLSVTLVASSVGYRDVLCFSKAFKRYTGRSPSEYRASLKKQTAQKRNSVPVFIL